MSTRDEPADFRTSLRAEELAVEGRVAVEAPAPRRSFGDTWWRHLVALVAVGFAIFPAVYVVSVSLSTPSANPAGTPVRPDSSL